MTAAGATMFARFAAPPNRRGYCGPDDHERLVGYGRGEITPDRGLRELARAFEGAWPWLELLAGAGDHDPLDERVVEAYWIGNALVDRVEALDLGNSLVARFGPRAGRGLDRVVAGVGRGARANHAFHVFGVYPWVGLLREGRGGDVALGVLDSCRISWGTVTSTSQGAAVARVAPLLWDGARLSLGAPRPRALTVPVDLGVATGDVVAIHWDTVCARLSVDQLRWLRAVNVGQMALAASAGIATTL